MKQIPIIGGDPQGENLDVIQQAQRNVEQKTKEARMRLLQAKIYLSQILHVPDKRSFKKKLMGCSGMTRP